MPQFGEDSSYDNSPERLMEAALASVILGRRFGEAGSPVSQPTNVYRVEMEDGRGPFNTHRDDRPAIYKHLTKQEPGWPGWLLTFPQFRQEQMGVTEAVFYHTHGGAAYGCESLASLNTWFPAPARSWLVSYGAKIVQYCVPAGEPILSLKELAGEVVFNPVTAIKVATMPIDMEITDAPLI